MTSDHKRKDGDLRQSNSPLDCPAVRHRPARCRQGNVAYSLVGRACGAPDWNRGRLRRRVGDQLFLRQGFCPVTRSGAGSRGALARTGAGI